MVLFSRKPVYISAKCLVLENDSEYEQEMYLLHHYLMTSGV